MCKSSKVVNPNVLENKSEQITITAGYRPSAPLILQQSVSPAMVFQRALIQCNFIKIIPIAFDFNLCNVYLDNKFVEQRPLKSSYGKIW